MSEWEEFRQYLPKYLSTHAKDDLFVELSQFPANIDSRLYTAKLREENSLLQGDGLANVWVSNLPDERIDRARVMVLSNTCDVSPENDRVLGSRLMYCPIIRMSAYAMLWRESAGGRAIDEHLTAIRTQRVSTMFYLPKNTELTEECIALLDRTTNCDLQKLSLHELVGNRLFTLSDYGFYMFIFKLSIHFTRIREGVSRS
jgi:hypothetical protein